MLALLASGRLRRSGRTGQQDDLVLDGGKPGGQSRTVLAARRPDVAHPGRDGRAGTAGAHSAPDRRGRVQRLQDHASDHAGGWAGQPRRGRAGRARARRSSDALRRQPGLLSAALGLYQGTRRLPARGQVLRSARRTSTRTTPLPRPISSKRNRPARRRRRTSSPAPTPSASSA